MKEVRLHGRGGQGLVKAAHIIVKAAVATGKYASFIPFFGVERKGSPVYGFLRLDDKPIRLRTQVYSPDYLIVLDDTLIDEVNLFEGLKENAVLVINSGHSLTGFNLPEEVSTVGLVDATNIALKNFKKNIPNTTMLGAFCRATGWVALDQVKALVEEEFGPENTTACEEGYQNTNLLQVRCR